jgi:hypothetical protein
MEDLLYEMEPDELAALKKAFPHVKIENASDDIHRDRYSVELPKEDDREYRKHLFRTGIFHCSLVLGIEMRDGDSIPLIKDILKELQEEKEDPNE